LSVFRGRILRTVFFPSLRGLGRIVVVTFGARLRRVVVVAIRARLCRVVVVAFGARLC